MLVLTLVILDQCHISNSCIMAKNLVSSHFITILIQQPIHVSNIHSEDISTKINPKNQFTVGVFLVLCFSKPIFSCSSCNRVLSSTMLWILIHFFIIQNNLYIQLQMLFISVVRKYQLEIRYEFEWKFYACMIGFVKRSMLLFNITKFWQIMNWKITIIFLSNLLN